LRRCFIPDAVYIASGVLCWENNSFQQGIPFTAFRTTAKPFWLLMSAGTAFKNKGFCLFHLSVVHFS
jgi:hypothetical protein